MLNNMQQVKLLLDLSDPVEWSCGNVQKWLLWTEHLYRLPQVGKAFQDLDGKDLCAMTEEDFRQRCPQCGDTLHAHLDIWKSGAFGTYAFSCNIWYSIQGIVTLMFLCIPSCLDERAMFSRREQAHR